MIEPEQPSMALLDYNQQHQILKIRQATHRELAWVWKNALSDDFEFGMWIDKNPFWDYFKARFNAFGGMTPSLSKWAVENQDNRPVINVTRVSSVISDKPITTTDSW